MSLGREQLVVVATVAEAGPVVETMAQARREEVGRRKIFTGTIAEEPVRVLVTGPGQVNTAQALTAVFEKRRPGLVIQTGCAGYFDSSGLGIGDLALATEEIDAHLGLETATPGDPPARLPWPVLRTGQGDHYRLYPLDVELVSAGLELLRPMFEPEGVQVAAGPFLSVATITTTDRTAAVHEKRWGAVMENMEGAAAAHVCALYDLPFLEIRSASNRVGRRNKEEWDLLLAAARAAEAVVYLIANGLLGA
ncbi:MAG: futalosine hydrolase [Proteobacteria bacterium]|nr:futalosine hydrolase [Pseudomonadota bacterium]